MKTITIQVPDDCDVQIVKKEEKKTEPVIRTYQDLIDNKVKLEGFYIGTSSDLIDSDLHSFDKTANTNNKNIASSEKVAKSMLAMAMISQLIVYYGGAVTDEEWRDFTKYKYIIRREDSRMNTLTVVSHWSFLAFHNREQRDNFLKYNEQLVKDYLMID